MSHPHILTRKLPHSRSLSILWQLIPVSNAGDPDWPCLDCGADLCPIWFAGHSISDAQPLIPILRHCLYMGEMAFMWPLLSSSSLCQLVGLVLCLFGLFPPSLSPQYWLDTQYYLVLNATYLRPLLACRPISWRSPSRADNPPWTERTHGLTGLKIKVMPSLSSYLLPQLSYFITVTITLSYCTIIFPHRNDHIK